MKKLLILSLILFLSIACKDNEETPKATENFTVTIENVFSTKPFFMSGATGLIMPGESESFSFYAGIGHKLSFATMFVQSNDLFYAPDAEGMSLYDNNRNALSGDVTSMIDLWDAGTEVNQEPGVGPDQAPRQSGPDTGADENGTVNNIMDVSDGFTYPSDEEIIRVEITHDGGTKFTATISNISNTSNLPTPFAPGVWLVYAGGNPLFTVGEVSSEGLEDLAEDGNQSILSDDITDNTGYVSPFAPGIWAVFDGDNPIHTIGQATTNGLEALAEDGDPSALAGNLSQQSGVRSSGTFTVPVGASSAAPILPGEKYSFNLSAEEGYILNFATMLVQTNDLYVAFTGQGVALFNNGTPISGDITSQISLFDVGTEVNEYPGAGNSQAPRQGSPDIGDDENGVVGLVNDAFTYPSVGDMIKVTITAN